MQLIIKRIMWGVLALMSAGLLLTLAWLASNWFDVKAQPWPEALTPRANSIAVKDDFWGVLMAAPASGVSAPRLSLGDCKSSDCRASWRDDSSRWPAMRQAHAALGAACESATKLQNLQLVEPVPATFKPDVELPKFQQLIGCSAWLLSLALEASTAGNIDLATTKLAQSARLSMASLKGSQSLIGHMITLALVDRHLQALQQVAIQHPTAAAALESLPLPTTAQIASAQRRWVAHEASVARDMIFTAISGEECLDESGLGSWYCRIGVNRKLPNYMEQLFSNHWQQVLASIRDDSPLGAFNAYQAYLEDSPTGLFGSQFHWRGTIPHILLDVSKPAYQGYIARSANTLLAAQTTKLWLRVQSQAPGERATWLARQIEDTPLVDRLTVQPQGDWKLQILDAANSLRVPTRWPAWPA